MSKPFYQKTGRLTTYGSGKFSFKGYQHTDHGLRNQAAARGGEPFGEPGGVGEDLLLEGRMEHFLPEGLFSGQGLILGEGATVRSTAR